MVNSYHGCHRDDNLDDTFVLPPVVLIFQDHYLEVLLGKNSATVNIEQCSVVIVLCLWYTMLVNKAVYVFACLMFMVCGTGIFLAKAAILEQQT